LSPAVAAEGRAVFRTLLLYEDYPAARRATETCNLILARLGEEFELRCSMWKFEALRNAKLRDMAAIEATEADVIIVAARGCLALPPEVTAWVDTWLPGQVCHPAALIAVVDSAHQRGSRTAIVSDYLQRVAANAKMDFLLEVANFESSDVSVTSTPEDAEPSLTLPGEMPRWEAADRHWGINE